ncbi:hypothetical protein EMIHUDRAFT_109293 [Emiliania huxleyi CCMP1516]|uniref:Hydroxyproline O-arabinosyltransferase-like domain-containing protein n=2 Tax=Emiliania huxleyi TaxID=2903 RepID=A0A0D3KS78_EMIH1|nr:hypothetical protein EMIHUDRAFT_109293 [Emiliania huxleyi CCMP1516]EOD38613.1 hypothetical protein EMIHUDRAFT_109293 [Emiliania huxleyi CCMP1516]|eukprot:XP_005791042.1 hypothetical protein EMIHUDRAFT_109293 [Emiliania huxleyi CCMP1516]
MLAPAPQKASSLESRPPVSKKLASRALIALGVLLLVAAVSHLHELAITLAHPLEQSAARRPANQRDRRGQRAAAAATASAAESTAASQTPGSDAALGARQSAASPGSAAAAQAPASNSSAATGRSQPAAAAAAASPPPPACGAERRPYHVLLTAASGTYQEWQTRIAYHYYRQLKAAQPCSDLGGVARPRGFTRLLSTPDGRPDGLMGEIPTVLTKQLGAGRCDECSHGFVVMNRPWSLRQYFASKEAASLAEDYLFVIETDHLLLRPPRNRATEASPVAFGFYYMTYKYDARKLGPVIRRWHDPDDVDPVGPSPLIVHKAQLRGLIEPWWRRAVAERLCLELKRDREADQALGWVLEMWAYTLAAARTGVHKTFQAEPGGAGIYNLDDHDIYHYTFDLDQRARRLPGPRGRPPARAQDFSWSKRHFMSRYPPRLPEPPRSAKPSTLTFIKMMNGAIDAFGDRWGVARG